MVRDRLPDAGRWPDHLRARLAVDTRSLALFRILAGLLIVVDVLLRARNFRFFYTDDGVVPQSLAEQYVADNAFSLFFYTSDPRAIAALFAIHALVGIVLLVGYRSRLAVLVSLLFVVSLDHHNPLTTSYADILFRLLLLWAIFLPVGERWSVDAVLRNRAPRQHVAGLATFAFLAQLVTMYYLNGLHKAQSPVWWDGTATPLILGNDHLTFLAGPYVRQLPIELLRIGSLGWFALMLAAPLLLLLVGRPRYLLALLYVGGHLVFAITVRIGAFPYVAIAGLLLFFQAAFYHDLHVVATRLGLRDRLPQTTIQAIRTRAVAGADRFPRLAIPSPGIHRAVSIARIAVLVVAVIGVLVLPWAGWGADAANLSWEPDVEDHVDDRLATVGLDQPPWQVFAPTPRHLDVYYVFAAVTVDGEQLDVHNDRPLRYDRPDGPLHHQFRTYRERFYMYRVGSGGRPGGPSQHLLEHYCDRWPGERGVELHGIVAWEITEPINVSTITDPDRRDRQARLIDQHSCTGDALPQIDPPGFYW